MTRYNLAGRTVAITGSTGGLGSAVAQALRERGANLALLDLDAHAVSQQAVQLGGQNVARGWAADVRHIDTLQAALDGATEHFGRLDVVIANAGIDTMAPMAKLDPEAFDRVIDINLKGVWRTFRAALPHVQEQRGHLLAISSMAAFCHSPLQASYTASKAGVWAMCNSIRLEIRHLGVTVGSVHPTFFKTPLMDHVVADPAGNTLWGGNQTGIFKFIDIKSVVKGIVTGIERRKPMVVVPKSHTIVAKAPGLARPIIDRIGFRGSTIPDAIAQSSRTGWNKP
ncbi:short-chain dehydrogenase [Nocardioides gansuensis]|uniref:Short-chain dehydrogenase n=1 Tax=Nocardioides gansuensis TaxID=2138300 RepID=A0A2T8FDM3_9ACTN|nr:SDR family NAD(P)-dependent oxidoreductase [Nocardioides gansuensis]PVG83800.1 short-chain dehydrogenase [Nocardioides gansuensis]